MNYYVGHSEHPVHLSVGAVLLNEKGEVCCHHFLAEHLTGYWKNEGITDAYLLMRETMHIGETPEQTLHRGLMEEFGATAELVDYLGSIQGEFPHKDVLVQKTTLYFLVKLVDQDLTKRDLSDIEGKTLVEWQTPDFLIPYMEKQEEMYKRGDVNESAILKRVQNFYL